MGAIAVRSAEFTDLDGLRHVYRRASLSNEGDRPNLLAHPEVLVFAGDGLRAGRTVVAVQDDRVLGFATLAGAAPTMELDDLFVDPDRMRQGIATMLMSEIADRARAAGAVALEVTANDHALAFYASVGFVMAGERDTLFGLAVRLVLQLDGSTTG